MPRRVAIPTAIVAALLHVAAAAAATDCAVGEPTSAADCNQSGLADDCEVPPPTFDAGRRYVLHYEARSVAAADFDGDGTVDFAGAVGEHEVGVLLSRGAAGLTLASVIPVSFAPGVASAGELTGDGRPDLIVLEGLTVRVLRNTGAGHFESQSTQPLPTQARTGAIADFDRDGDADVVVAVDFPGRVLLYANDGHGNLASPVTLLSDQDRYVIDPVVAAADVEGDGDSDLVVGDQNGAVLVLRNDGHGAFAAPVSYESDEVIRPAAIALGDVTGDGRPDIVIANAFQRGIAVLRNAGDGTFGPPERYSLTYENPAIALGDFDGDDDLDIVTPQLSYRPQIVLLRNDGGGSFAAAVSVAPTGPTSLLAVDVDGDGVLDLAAVADSGLVLLRNRGQADFAAATAVLVEERPVAVAAADLTGDGRADLAVANSQAHSVSIARSLGDGRFAEARHYSIGVPPGSGTETMRVAAADLDGDGDQDVAVVHRESNRLIILRNAGDGTFAASGPVAAGRGPVGIAATDLDGDGAVDLAVATVSDGIAVLRNRGDGTFATPVPYGTGTILTLAVADIDDDGDADVLTGGERGTIAIYRNAGDGTLVASESAEFPSSGIARAIDAADLDGDGRVDLFVSSDAGLGMLRGLGDGRFDRQVPIGGGLNASAVVADDLDGDGTVDLAVESELGTGILRNNGHAVFSPPAYFDPWINYTTGMALGDVDGDGRRDIAITHENGNQAIVLLNRSARPTRPDCNADGVPDECELAGNDCADNGIPDECEPDSDGDGTVDSCDECPTGDERVDSDGDRVPDCRDNCPVVANAGQLNRDGDATGDACDGCDGDPLKSAPGQCGCGKSDVDSDGDRTADCRDRCPNDPFKIAPGRCGCGILEGTCGTPTRTPTPTRTATPTRTSRTPSATPTPTTRQRTATFVVDSQFDATDREPGDDRCVTLAGSCSLRAAIDEANAVDGRDVILLPPGVFVLSLPGADDDTGASGDLDVLDDIELRGAGADQTIIDGGALDRVLEIGSEASADVIGVTIRNGRYTGPSFGFGVAAVGGVYNRGRLVLSRSTVTDNRAELFGTSTGGVSNAGRLTLIDTLMSSNFGGSTGGLYNVGTAELRGVTTEDNRGGGFGGDINSGGVVDVRDSRFHLTLAFDPNGAALFAFGGTMTIADSEIADAVSGAGVGLGRATVDIRDSRVLGCAGGGIRNGTDFDAGTLTVERVTLADNGGDSANGDGGLFNRGTASVVDSTISGNHGLYGGGIDNTGTLALRNVTISRNSAEFGAGGIRNGAGTVDARSVTITDNSGDDGGGVMSSGGATLALASSIVAGNHDDAAPDCSGTLVTHGHNLLGSAIACAVTGSATGDLIGVDPDLGPLADNGGPTQTHALGSGSPAIDAGDDCGATDQRGVPRPHGAACDIGAVEETVSCGNGAVDPPESCDDGGLANGDCCSATCQFEHPPLAGDANCDGAVTAADLSALSKSLGGGSRSPCRLDDADGDCALTAGDLAATAAAVFR